MTTSNQSLSSPHHSFISWMKCLGILLIVYGHMGTTSINALTSPILPKQLGVAFFLFTMGFSLAGEHRAVGKVLFNRLFEIFLFGISFALLASAVTWAWFGKLSLSNYGPFLLGCNVVFNNFPANPTTWYIGTYIHVLLIWALFLRNCSIRWWMLVLAAVGELIARVILLEAARPFVAYMALSNWVTVFLLGIYCGQHRQKGQQARAALVPYLLALGALIGAWPLANHWLPRDETTFPFRLYSLESLNVSLALTSIAVTFLYVTYTLLAYHVTRRIGAPRLVEFCARNTMIVFIAHMPVLYVIRPFTGELATSEWVGKTINFAVCFVGLMLLSEGIRKGVRPKDLRDRVWQLLAPARVDELRPGGRVL